MKKYIFTRYFLILLISLFFYSSSLCAQNITGTWEGFMRDEYLQINIKQTGTTVCGFTYDYVIASPKNHCRAYYAGRFEDGMLLISGTSFIENSGAHVLMTIGLLTRYVNGELVLQGRVDTNTFLDSDLTDREAEVVTLKRMSKIPRNVPGTGSPCYNGKQPKPFSEKENNPFIKNQPQPKTEKPALKPAPAPKPKPGTPSKTPETNKNVQPVKPNKDPVIPITKEKAELPQRISERKKEEQGKLTVNARTVYLKIYDNGVVDGDTVSVYFDGKLLVDKQRLSEKAIEVQIELQDNDIHELTLFAENLGGIPPNTALIVVTAGSKRYELRSSADLKKNAVLLFEYRPD